MFDMDGTLLDLHFDNYFWQDFLPQAWARAKGIDQLEARDALHRKYTEVRGTLDWYCLDFWSEQLQLDITLLKHQVRHKISIRPKVPDLLARLRAHGKRLLLVTNAHPGSLELKLGQTGIGHYFDRAISSHALRLAKENQGFWTALMGMETYDPARTLLVDDSLPVLRQAAREGIRHLFAIHQPDSRQEPLQAAEFPQIIDFEHIMPPHPVPAGQPAVAPARED